MESKLTDRQVLYAVIGKAIKGGWEAEPLGDADTWLELSELERQYVVKLLTTEGEGNGYMLFIFNHDFCKALWHGRWCAVCKIVKPGEKHLSICSSINGHMDAWEYRIAEMGKAKNRIDYLRKHAL